MKIKRDNLTKLVNRIALIFIINSLVVACSPRSAQNPASANSIPPFDHIVLITFENKGFQKTVGNPYMPTFNRYARDYTLLTQFYAETHPSLPNYLAMIGGSTFDVEEDCFNCFINAVSLPDVIEASGRTWKTYQEDMQDPCGLGSQDDNEYVQKHNPFVYFDPIRKDHARCQRSVVPLDALQQDIHAGTLPNFIFITPNMCNNAHDCKLMVTDAWLMNLLDQLIPALEKNSTNYLIVLNWDEGQDDGSCCGLPKKGGGRIAVVLISPWVKEHFRDATPYTHYSLLKTISNSWDLPYLGQAAQDSTSLILAPWKSNPPQTAGR